MHTPSGTPPATGSLARLEGDPLLVLAQAEAASLTPPAAGTTRIYRAQLSPEAASGNPLPCWMAENADVQSMLQASGRWWTVDLIEAVWYLKHEYPDGDGQLVWTDVPDEEVRARTVAALTASDLLPGENPGKFSHRGHHELFLARRPDYQQLVGPEHIARHRAASRVESFRSRRLATTTTTLTR